MFSDFKGTVLNLLNLAVRNGKYDIPVGQVLTGLIRHTLLFQHINENDRYSRAFRYAMQLRPFLLKVGWDLKDVGGRKHFSLICPAARKRDYSKCDNCDKRVECLLDPLHQ